MISVVIPLYNKAGEIEKTLESVFAQTYKDYEIVIVDDGSTDGSAEIVERIADSRIRLIRQKNAGVSAARNRGIREAKGEYIAFLDADDEWLPQYLETQLKLSIDYPECDVFATNYQFRNESNETTYTILRNLPFEGDSGVLSNYFEVASTSHPPICSITIMAKKEAFVIIGGFPVGVASGEDLLTWARLAARYKIAFSTKPLAIYNLGDGYDYSNLPPRRQDYGDPVGKGLKEIYKVNPKIKGLRQYISHWHKMRASVAIRYGERFETLKEVTKSLFYNPYNFKVMPFIALAVVPSKLRTRIISQYKK